MGDSACLLHGFSYASAIPNESKQGNPMHVLGESISFGRFTTESLSWEKWSAFSSHKKYVEEAESYARPGSVAQKKAFFEAHYKRIAAQKAAALLEQQNAAKAESGQVHDEEDNDNDAHEEERVLLNSDSNDNVETEYVKIQDEREDDLVKINSIIVAETGKEGGNDVITGNEASKESPVKRNSDNLENQDTISALESSETPQIERPLLKQNSVNSSDVPSVTSKKRSDLSSLKTSIQHKTWRVPYAPVKQVTPHCKKDNVITGNEVSEVSIVKRKTDNLGNQDTVSPSESSGTPQIERPLLKQKSVNSNDVPSVTSKKRSGLSTMKTSVQHKTWKVPSTPTKQVTPYCKRENNVIQSTRKSNVDQPEENRSPPKSLRALMNLVSSNEPDKESMLPTKKTQSSGLAHSSCSTPFKTPAQAFNKSASTYPATTPRSENRRMKTPIDSSATGRKTTGPKWHILSAVCAKSLSAYRNKLQSPTVSTPFTLRTEERAAKRKQKLEEKFNASEVQKMQLQKSLKEKAGNEFRKLSCSLCFKARPLPDFYKERETPKNRIKTQAAQPQSTVLGRSMSNKKQGIVSMPPPPPPPTCLAKNSVSKNLPKKNVVNQSKLHTRALTERIMHENASPNIQ